MTIERLAIFSAETRVITDLAWYANGPAISSAQAKTGTYSYTRGFTVGPTGKALLSPLAAIRTGFWLYQGNASRGDATYLYHGGMGRGAAKTISQIHIYFNDSSGLLEVRRPLDAFNFETLASASMPSQFSTTGAWFPIGITHKIHASDGFLSVYVGGVRVLNLVGDTRPSYQSGGQQFDTTTANVLVAGGASSSGAQGFNTAFVDDHYIDSYVGEDDAPVPATRFLFALPDGVGADNAWTPVGSATHYQNVDENPNTGDTDYNKALSADLRDTYTFGNITLPVDHRIKAVIPTAFAKRLDSEINNGLSFHAWDGLTYEDSADQDLYMTYDAPAFARMTLQPDGSEWNEADFNAMQFGVRSRGSF